MRIAVDWLLRSDIGEVIKTIVADETAFPDYAMPKKATGRKSKACSTRYENACDLLRNSERRISEIAFAVGFQSLSQFNRVFKKLSGKSPTEFREVVIPKAKT